MTESNVELARRGYEAALRGDLDTVAEMLDPEVKWHGGDPSAAGACQNRGQALDFMRRARSRRPIGELVDVRGSGEVVVVIMRAAAAEHEPAALHASLTTFRAGKAVEIVHYEDPREALAVAGM